MSVEKFKNAGIEIPYVIIPNQTAQDKNLSWAARGLLAFMLSLPTDWVFHTEWLIQQSPNCKRDKLKNLIRELKNAGYLERVQNKNAQGEYTCVETVVHPVKMRCAPVDGKPVDGNTVDGESATTNETDPQSKQETNISAPTDAHVNAHFDSLWKAWPNKKNKKRAQSDFKRFFRGKSDNTIADTVKKLLQDIQARLQANQLGFKEMMLSTYLNNERWEDDLPTTEKPATNGVSYKTIIDRIKSNYYRQVGDLNHTEIQAIRQAAKHDHLSASDRALLKEFEAR